MPRSPQPPPFAASPSPNVSDEALREAARHLLSGGLIGMPTETVYGLAADATNGLAVAAIYAAKGRPSFNPLICHVDGPEMAAACARIDARALELMDRFWPGPLSLVLPRSDTCPVSELATAGLSSIAVRSPAHPVALELIRQVGRPLAAPSANRSEELSPTTARHVIEGLGERAPMVLDGGTCLAGIESTIVSLIGPDPVMLRPGAVTRHEIEQIIGPLSTPHSSSGVISPGMMRRHYAPRARLRLNATTVGAGEAFLAFGPSPASIIATLNLSESSRLDEAAANLFSMLRELDSKFEAIAIAPIPNEGLGEGINDRIKRASAHLFEDGV
ncbi:MAG: threonylcarbamoyl-AMP synthase [Alphaproteobacteria bacterium]|nr:threonylcarbamoyl-AMP synthase [Alphaproteobacteria bacterium]